MSPELQSIQVSEPLLQTIMHEHIEGLCKRKATRAQGEKIRERWENDNPFFEAARSALSEAIVFSTLAGTALSLADFESETGDLKPIEDPVISALRAEVFQAGIRCAVESIGPGSAKELNISERVQVFERKTRTEPGA